MLGETVMAIMYISRFLKQRGKKMDIKDIIKQSQAICENEKCGTCALKNTACIDKHGHVNASDASELIALENYLESVKPEKKGKAKK